MSARDEFAKDLFLADTAAVSIPDVVAEKEWDECREHNDYAYDLADRMVAMGYRKAEVVSYVVITRDGRFVKDFGGDKTAADDFAADSTGDCSDAGIDWDYRVAEIVEVQA